MDDDSVGIEAALAVEAVRNRMARARMQGRNDAKRRVRQQKQDAARADFADTSPASLFGRR